MDWIYLSPHLDDAALSCGGLLWEQNQAQKETGVWTICAGDPPPGPLSPFAQSLHTRWREGREAVARRREEDRTSCAHLGATPRHFPIPDCIYRQAGNQHLYTSEESLFGPLHLHDDSLIRQLRAALGDDLPSETNLVCPLGLGGHVDHRLTRAAAEGLVNSLWYYADYPYVLREEEFNLGEDWQQVIFPVSRAGLNAWQNAVAAHASQISTFWVDIGRMQEAIEDYCLQIGGLRLWHKK